MSNSGKRDVCLLQYVTMGVSDGRPFALIAQMSKEERVLVAVLLFVLATPLGFVINAIGWFLFEQPHGRYRTLLL
jgi:hypothetical protein